MKCSSLTGIVRRKVREAAGTFGEQGAALITALLFLVILTMLGLASIMTSSTEMLISRNDRLSKLSLDYANAGVQEALARLDLQSGALQLGNYTTKAITANPAAVPWRFHSTDAGAVLPYMNFSGTISYRLEDDLHKRDMASGGIVNGEVVGYSQDCGYNKSPVASVSDAYPIYVIKSTGWVKTGNTQASSSKVVIEVSRNTLNLNVPGALYSASCIDANGNVSITGGTKPAYVTSCNSDVDASPGDGISVTGGACNVTSSATPPHEAGVAMLNMTGVNNFLGMSLGELKTMASTSSTYYELNGATWSPVAPTPPWGDYVNQKNPKVVYIDTKGGQFTMSGNSDNFGILVVKGNFKTTGNVKWKGLVYVTGNMLAASGTITVEGGVMAGGATKTTLNGTVNINYNKSALDSVARQAFHTKIINWRRILN